MCRGCLVTRPEARNFELRIYIKDYIRLKESRKYSIQLIKITEMMMV